MMQRQARGENNAFTNFTSTDFSCSGCSVSVSIKRTLQIVSVVFGQRSLLAACVKQHLKSLVFMFNVKQFLKVKLT